MSEKVEQTLMDDDRGLWKTLQVQRAQEQFLHGWEGQVQCRSTECCGLLPSVFESIEKYEF